MSNLADYLSENAPRFEDELCELLRIPSVSADPAHAADVARAADWVAGQFRAMGLPTEVVSARSLGVEGHPLVLAETPPVPDAPVAVVYGHYDVQPPEPFELWQTPPFEPDRRDGNLYARGATDDKGQMLTHLKSTEAWLKTEGRLPLQLKFVIEGEEECGGQVLSHYLARHADRLRCDCIVISDGAQFAPDVPAICLGLRGIAAFELRLRGPERDLHSGSFGGTVTNPLNALTQMLAALVDQQGRVRVPGFYDDVVELTDREKAQLAELPFDEEAYLREVGVDATAAGEQRYSLLERRWIRPTFDLHGLSGGYQGEGAKTVLPSHAMAKFSFRLVPRQDPQQITESLRAFLHDRCPAGIRMELVEAHGSPGVLVSAGSPYVAAAGRAIGAAFGRGPVFTREGGSIPIVSELGDRLGADVLLLGWGQNDDNTHAPNEKFSLEDFHRGIHASAQLWRELAAT
jgi:succinyl-diaminopimelate desuccinylase